ncbi:CHAP domain-containing protein [Acidisoma sp. 7E03]
MIHTVWRTRSHGHGTRISSGVYRNYLECVPYARQVSGIQLSGDARYWWNEAPGRYDRGQAPQPGAVLNFRANGRMPRGHVAVVQQVVNRREILITQANWGGPGFTRGGVSSDISVVDVSPRNDWTAVRVALGHSSTYGSVYPTYGFIYRDSAPALRMAEAGPAPMLNLGNQPPADLRNAADRHRAKSLAGTIQYASAPSFDGPAIATSAPDRNLR